MNTLDYIPRKKFLIFILSLALVSCADSLAYKIQRGMYLTSEEELDKEIEKEANINETDSGLSPLGHALSNMGPNPNLNQREAFAKTAELLILKGAKLTTTGKEKHEEDTPLILAARCYNDAYGKDYKDLISEKLWDYHRRNLYRQWKCNRWEKGEENYQAYTSGEFDPKYPNIEYRCPDKLPPEIYSSNTCVRIMKLLLEKGEDVNFSTGIGGTPLGNATINGHVAGVKFLLEKGAYVNSFSSVRHSVIGVRNETPLKTAQGKLLYSEKHEPERVNDYKTIIALLKKAGGLEDTNTVLKGAKPSFAACSFAKFASTACAIKNVVDKGGESEQYVCEAFEQLKKAACLVEGDVKENIKDGIKGEIINQIR